MKQSLMDMWQWNNQGFRRWFARLATSGINFYWHQPSYDFLKPWPSTWLVTKTNSVMLIVSAERNYFTQLLELLSSVCIKRVVPLVDVEAVLSNCVFHLSTLLYERRIKLAPSVNNFISQGVQLFHKHLLKWTSGIIYWQGHTKHCGQIQD